MNGTAADASRNMPRPGRKEGRDLSALLDRMEPIRDQAGKPFVRDKETGEAFHLRTEDQSDGAWKHSATWFREIAESRGQKWGDRQIEDAFEEMRRQAEAGPIYSVFPGETGQIEGRWYTIYRVDPSKPIQPAQVVPTVAAVASPHHEGEGSTDSDYLETIRASDVKIQPVRWLWNGFLASGKFHVLAGSPGTAKTTIAMGLAATVTRGGNWPDGSPCLKPGNVFIWSGEDAPSDTLAPRLALAGADLDKVLFAENVRSANGERFSFDPALHMALLRARIRSAGSVRLLVLDPVVSAVTGDSHKNTEVRRGLQPIVDLAEELDIAVLGITHLSKGSEGRSPLDRVTGSLAFGAVPRVVLLTAKNEKGKDGPALTLVRAKSNIGPDGGGFGYDIFQEPLADNPDVEASRVAWNGAIEGSARSILAEVEASVEPGDRSALEEAMAFLRELLADGPLAPRDIWDSAKEAGQKERTVRRAQEALGIHPRTIGKIRFAWSLPAPHVGHVVQPLEFGQVGQHEGIRTPSEHLGQNPEESTWPSQQGEARHAVA